MKYLIIIYISIVNCNGVCGSLIECSSKIPRQLANKIIVVLPEFDIPNLKYLDRKSIDFDLSNGGDGCFAVANGKFGGDETHKDYSILLMSKIGQKPKLIVALSWLKTWKIYQLQTFCDAMAYCYVKTKRAGVYRRTQSLDFNPIESGEPPALPGRQ